MHKRRRVGEEYQLAPGERLTGQHAYRVVRCLGGGAFAIAYQVADESGQVLFAKELREPERPSEAQEGLRVYQRECDVLRRLGNYELIPRIHDAFVDSGFHYIIQDYIEGVDLDTLLRSGKTPDHRTVTRWCVGLCHILAFLHSRHVVHHDLKPSNIRLNQEGDPVLLDFGAARWFRRPDEKSDSLYGTEGYLAPEYAEQSVEDLAAGMKMDVFAMGRILVELMVGKRLSQEDIDRRTEQLYGAILHSQLLDHSFVRAVFRSVDYDPERRYNTGLEMEQDVMAAAPPAGRVRPLQVVFREQPGPWREASFTVFNVGGGTLNGTAHVEGDWLGIGSGASERGREHAIQRNRSAVRLVALPERVRPGQLAEGRVIFQFPDQDPIVVPVRLERPVDLSQVHVSPAEVRLQIRPGTWGRGSVTFRNQGNGDVSILLDAPADPPIGLDPSAFTLAPNQQQEVAVSVDAATLTEPETDLALAWRVDGGQHAMIPLRLRVRKGGGLGSLFRRD